MLHHFEELARRLGVEVRYQAAAGRVGLCVLRGERVAVIDANLRVPDRVAALASVLAGEDLNGIYVPPAVRKRLDQSRPLRVRPGEDWGEMGEPTEPEEAEAPEAAPAEPPAVTDAPPEEPVQETGADPEAGAE